VSPQLWPSIVIEVLVDRDAVSSGAAAAGEPWQYYDLGHGYCTYTFFEQRPHRMACARCNFYAPKASTKGQLLEAKENLQRMLTEIPLTEDEQAAVEDGQAALDRLMEKLADTPTPSGQIPHQLDVPATATLLPIATELDWVMSGLFASQRRSTRRPARISQPRATGSDRPPSGEQPRHHPIKFR
jgi:hypothetical protein